MPISYVGAGTSGNGSAPTISVPSGYQERDLLVIVTTGAGATTTPSGWTSRPAQGAAQFISIFYKFATASEASVTLTISGATGTAIMLAYRGVSATDTIAIYSTNASGTSIATNSFINTYANEYVISIFASSFGVATWTAPGSVNTRANIAGTAPYNGLLICDELQAPNGSTSSRTANISVAKALSAGAFSIIPSGRYWIGTTGSWDGTTTNWSFSSGGSGGAPSPTAQDNVYFDKAGTYTVTLTGSQSCLDFTTSNGSPTITSGALISLGVYGNFSINSTAVISVNTLNFLTGMATGKTIASNGGTISSPNVSFTSTFTTGVYRLAGATTFTSASPSIANGTLDLNGFTLTAPGFSTTAGTKTLLFNGGSLVLTGSGTTVFNNVVPTGFTVRAGSAVGTISMTSASAKTFVSGTGTIYNCILNQGGAGALTINAGASFYDITNTYKTVGATTITFGSGTTTLLSNFSASGEATRVLSLTGSSSTVTLSSTAAIFNVDYLNVGTNITFTPLPSRTQPIVWFAGPNSTGTFISNGIWNIANSSPWKVYPITTTGASTFTVPSNWIDGQAFFVAIGGGGGGAGGNNATGGGGGGGGGAFARSSSLGVTSGNTVFFSVGTGGGAGGVNAAGTAGGDTWVNKVSNAAPTSSAQGILAKGGSGGAIFGGGSAAGGSSASSFGQFLSSGGSGGGGAGSGGGGGGSAGSGLGTGGNGAASSGSGGYGGGGTGGPASATTGGIGYSGSAGGIAGFPGGSGTAGSGGGGGSAQSGSPSAGAGGPGGGGIELFTLGSGGGGGGGGNNTGVGAGGAGAAGGLYGGGGGGGGRSGTGSAQAGGAGAQGVILIYYIPNNNSIFTFR